MSPKEIRMKFFAFALVVLLEGLTGIPAFICGAWLIVYCLKPFIWFMASTMTLSTVTRLDGWYGWYGYWDLLPWFAWNEILITAIVSCSVMFTFEKIRTSTIFKKIPENEKSTK